MSSSDDNIIDLSTTIGNNNGRNTKGSIYLPTCIYNASGPRTGSSAALNKIALSSSGGVLAKSATILKQNGNPLPRTWHHEADEDTSNSSSIASLNSEGLPNSGIDYYISEETINESMAGLSDEEKKPYMVSISGKTLDDNIQMIQKILNSTANKKNLISCIELNLACPNIIGKPIIAYDFQQMDHVLDSVSKIPNITSIPLGIKMPPYFDKPHFNNAATIINKYKHIISYVACINTIGNSLAIDYISEQPYICSNNGFAGLSGPAVKYTALANVKLMVELLDESIDVVGVGGISTGIDVYEMLLCGAKAIQIGTCHWKEGPKCFNRIKNELIVIMKEKGLTSITNDVIGKLKSWSKDGVILSRNIKKKKKEEEKALLKEKTSSTNNNNNSDSNFYMMLCTILIVVIGILLADKYTDIISI